MFALKAILPSRVDSPGARARFAREAMTWVDISPIDGVVPADGVARLNDVPVILAKWMPGGDLRSKLGGTDAGEYFGAVIRLVGTMVRVWERRRVVHRDLKPSNILLDDQGLVNIGDWGLAKGLAAPAHKEYPFDHAASGLTSVGIALGTPPYMAPEQIRDASSVDWRADVYSLGCILYEWEMGRPPFIGRDALEGHLVREPSWPARDGPRDIFGVWHIIRRCLAKAPMDRFEDYGELLDALIHAAGRKGISLERPTILPEPSKKVLSPDGRFALLEGEQATEEIRRAQALMGLGRYEEARRTLTRFYFPTMLERPGRWHLGHSVACDLALCLMKLGQRESASRIFTRLDAATEKPVEFYLNYSWNLRARSKFRDAEWVSREGLHRFPDEKALAGNLMLSLADLGRFQEALWLERRRVAPAVDLSGLRDVAAVHQRKAKATVEDWPTATHHLREAVRRLTEGLDLNRQSAELRYMRAQVRRDLFRFQDAFEDLAVISEKSGGRGWSEWAAALWGELLWRTGELRSILEHSKKWLAKMEDAAAKSYLERVRCRVLLDNWMVGHEQDGARVIIRGVPEFYEAQVSERPEACTADDFIECARVREWLGDAESGLGCLDRCLERWPDHWRALMNRSHILLRAGCDAEALTTARRSVEAAPYRPEPLDGLAYVLKATGSKHQAKHAKERADDVHQLRMELARDQ